MMFYTVSLKNSYKICKILIMEDSYKSFALKMYAENCKERSAYGEKPYDSFQKYEEANRTFIKNLFDSK